MNEMLQSQTTRTIYMYFEMLCANFCLLKSKTVQLIYREKQNLHQNACFSKSFISSTFFANAAFPFNSFPTSGKLLLSVDNFANSLDPDQARQNMGPDLDPNCLTL